MPRTYSNIDKIRAELAWVNEPVDRNVFGCGLLCCEQTSLSVNVHVLRFIRLSFTTETGASFLCSDFGTSEKSCSLSPEGKSGSRSKRRK